MPSQIIIIGSSLSGILTSNPSKSYSQRALLCSYLSGSIRPINLGSSEDVLSIERALKRFSNHNLQRSDVTALNNLSCTAPITINVGESGLASRLLFPICALYNVPITINGEGSLLDRDMSFIVPTLQELGVNVLSNNGKLPITIQGAMNPAEIEIDGSHGSQFLSGLLFALPLLSGDSTICVKDLKSKPYVDITIDTLSQYGIEITHDNYKFFHIQGNQRYSLLEGYTVEGDWSGASTLLSGAAICQGGDLTINNLRIDSFQSDRLIVEALRDAGADVRTNSDSIRVRNKHLRGFHFDATHCPDLFPALVCLAIFCEGKSYIKGVTRLFNKESNRALTLQKEFGKLGANIDIADDTMIVYGVGGQSLRGANVDSHSDHRIAMSLAVAALGINNRETTISNPSCVNKSYPTFWQDLELISNNNFKLDS